METMNGPDMNLERLYLDIGPMVWGYLRRRIADPNIAEELFQETFLVAAADLARLNAASSKRAWLIGIARNLLREHLRHERRRLQPLAFDLSPVKEQPREDHQLDAMREAVGKLPQGQREVLELRLGQELSYVEIAEALQIPIGTVRSRMHNAVGSLRRWAEDAEESAVHGRQQPGRSEPPLEVDR
jgi:RNA polymerase sigma-70 factor, ECF subfamily